MVKDNVIFSLA